MRTALILGLLLATTALVAISPTSQAFNCVGTWPQVCVYSYECTHGNTRGCLDVNADCLDSGYGNCGPPP